MSRPPVHWPVRWNECTAYYGGTFDPPHVGHRQVVEGLFRLPGVPRVRVGVSASPPHKPGRAVDAEHRLEMCRLAFEGTGAVIDRREIDRADRTAVPSYTFDILTELRAEFGPNLAFVIGTDQLLDLPTWNRFPEITGLCHWIVLARKPNGDAEARTRLAEWVASGLVRPASEASFEGLPAWRFQGLALNGNALGTALLLVPTEAPALSSKEIREGLARTGNSPANTLAPSVEAYLKRNRLYGTGA